MKNKRKKEAKIQLIGWLLLILCAIFFLASGIKNQDVLAIIGSVIFLIACIVFMLPLMEAKQPLPTGKEKADRS